MTRAQLEKLARSALEALPPELQEAALMRALGVRVIAWSALRTSALPRVYASARAVAMIAEVG